MTEGSGRWSGGKPAITAAGSANRLTRRNVRLSLGGSIHDPTDPVGRLLFNVLAMVAEFERI